MFPELTKILQAFIAKWVPLVSSSLDKVTILIPLKLSSNPLSKLAISFKRFGLTIVSTCKNLLLKSENISWKEDIKVEYSRDNYFSELKESELLKERIQTLDMIQPHVGEYFTKEWVMKNILKLSEEDTKELDQEVDDENQDEVDKAQDNAPEKVDKDSDEA